MKRLLLGMLLVWPGMAFAQKTILVVTADAADYLLAAGGTIAGMIDAGATAHLIRVSNDEKESWDLAPEETARRNRLECEEAGRILGIRDVVSLGYRAAELADVPFTTVRDRIIFYIRHYKPTILFIPNPYTEFERALDRYYTGRAAEDAWRAAAFENYQPPFAEVGLRPHLAPELYYYAQPVDPRRDEPESTATFVPQPKTIDITKTFQRKIKAAQALKTINYSMARRLKERLTSTGRSLPLLDTLDRSSVNRLVEVNVRGLAGSGTPAEELRYAGVEYGVPSKYLK
jgi:LmbE family N-acetylglucosaminyl deacetylase